MMRARPLTTLVTLCESGLTANHLPVVTVSEPAPLGSIRGHIARANPLWRDYRDGSEALAIFQGPQAYISPSFYASKEQTGEVVPTWDYAIVHARGTMRFLDDAHWVRDLVTGLTSTHEMQRPQPWTIDDAPDAYIEKMMNMIVGFDFSIRSLTGKWKVSQNWPHADRQGVQTSLRNSGDADSLEIAAMLAARDL